ncbi:MAG: hypothetical protein APU95_01790 [Hadesarchaea archaeon YNP_N21]|jgi:creatinine amidohydrolase|nr:MAG: hypothetical protein APU95_01790 [Hadesarchaea archaeon YNP_N21]
MIELASVPWVKIEETLHKSDLAILPLGAIEEHGPHLPLSTDLIIAEAIAKKVAEKTDAILLPSIPYGYVLSGRDYPGSISIEAGTLSSLIEDICKVLLKQGIKKIAIINQHVPNAPIIRILSKKLEEELGIKLMCITMPGFQEILNEICESKPWHTGIVHAEEIETSLMLAIKPDLVDMGKAVKEYPPVPEAFDSMPISWRKLSKSGSLGDPTIASAEKGRKILDLMVKKAIEIIKSEY